MTSDDGDTALLQRARDGSRDALGEVLRRAGPRLLAIIRLRLGAGLRRQVESTDVLQATFVKALVGLPRFRGAQTRSFGAWLAGIAENEIRDLADHHGRQKRDAALTLDLDGHPQIATLAAAVRSETSRIALDEHALRLERAMEALSAEHREVIVERSLEERSFPQIAERMGRSADACRMLYARAMAALTMQMEASVASAPSRTVQGPSREGHS